MRLAKKRPPYTLLNSVSSFTPSEMRIADMVSRGFTNDDIARVLHYRPNTISAKIKTMNNKLGYDMFICPPTGKRALLTRRYMEYILKNANKTRD